MSAHSSLSAGVSRGRYGRECSICSIALLSFCCCVLQSGLRSCWQRTESWRTKSRWAIRTAWCPPPLPTTPTPAAGLLAVQVVAVRHAGCVSVYHPDDCWPWVFVRAQELEPLVSRRSRASSDVRRPATLVDEACSPMPTDKEQVRDPRLLQ